MRFVTYVARWYADGRLVASWPFLFSPEHITTPSRPSDAPRWVPIG